MLEHICIDDVAVPSLILLQNRFFSVDYYPSVSSEESVGEGIADVEVDGADHLPLHGRDLATSVRAVANVHEVLLKH